MAFTAAFNPATGAVDLSCTGLASGVTWVTFYYWRPGATTLDVVRGAYRVPVASGATGLYSHHDWPPGQDGAPALMYGAYLSTGVWDGQTSIAPRAEDQAWLKWLGFPFLNRRVKITEYTDPARDGRGTALEIARGVAPVAVQELMGSRRFSITVQTDTWDAWRDLDLALSVGGVMFLLADEEALGLPAVYFTIDKLGTRREPRHRSPRRWTTIELTEVAAPNYLYAGAISTWSTVRTSYATWQALMDAQPTWQAVTMIPASADDVIVGDS